MGKTTLVRSILEIFTVKGMKCVSTAPTSRAAKRLAETTERTAKTVHRLLEFDPVTGDFKKDHQHPQQLNRFLGVRENDPRIRPRRLRFGRPRGLGLSAVESLNR